MTMATLTVRGSPEPVEGRGIAPVSRLPAYWNRNSFSVAAIVRAFGSSRLWR